MNHDILKQIEGENSTDYICRVCGLREEFDLTWEELAAIINDELGCRYSESWYRKNFKTSSFPHTIKKVHQSLNDEATLYDTLLEIKKERIKAADERNQNMLAVRRLAREETLLEIAREVADKLNSKTLLPEYKYFTNNGDKAAILELSDWHYGIEIHNPWNIYNPEIAKKRIANLKAEVICRIKENNVRDLYIANLGDLISGRIHETIRIQNRIDVVSQALEVAEILVEFIADLSQYVTIYYVSTSDNHSRVEPKKESSLDLESLTRVIEPLLESRIQNLQHEGKCNTVKFIKSPFGPDIATFQVFGYQIGATHGHKDNPNKIVNNITLMTQNNYDLILSAHRHHFSASQEHNCYIICNGSLMGTDDYAANLRLNNQPSQNLIIVSQDSVVESIYPIIV